MTDWTTIEEEYRAGIFSVREIARRNGLGSHTSIGRKAQKRGWTRLDKEVRQKARQDLVAAAEASTATDGELIDAAAQIQVGVVETHRHDIGILRDIGRNLRDRLINQMEQLDATVIDQDGKQVDGGALNKLAACTHVFEGLSRAYSKLVPLERQAFSISERGGEAATDSMPLEDRLAYYEREDDIAAAENIVILANGANGANGSG